MTKQTFALSLAASLALALPAAAQEVSVAVPYGDLDLSSDSGIDRLDTRIRHAIESICGNPADETALPAKRSVRRCGKDALELVQDERQVAIAQARGRAYVEVAANESKTLSFPVRHR